MPPKNLKSAFAVLRGAQEADPLAQAVAARMVGQLNALPDVLGMGALSRLNLPAAYAGDQRSLQAVQRSINEAETGLASPGRRKILKQGAAMAARSAVPDSVANLVGTTALKKAVQDVVTPQEIPLESLQAAAAQAFENALKTRVPKGMEGFRLGDLTWVANDKPHRTLEELLALPDTDLQGLVSNYYGETVSPKKLRSWLSNYQQLSPENIAAKTGLPVEAVRGHLREGTLQNLLDDWRGGQETLDAFYDSTGKSQFRDYGFDSFPDSVKPEELETAIKEIHENENYDLLYDLYSTHHMKAPYDEHLFGNNLDRLEKVPGDHVPTRMQQQEMLDNADDGFWDRVADMFYDLENQ